MPSFLLKKNEKKKAYCWILACFSVFKSVSDFILAFSHLSSKCIYVMNGFTPLVSFGRTFSAWSIIQHSWNTELTVTHGFGLSVCVRVRVCVLACTHVWSHMLAGLVKTEVFSNAKAHNQHRKQDRGRSGCSHIWREQLWPRYRNSSNCNLTVYFGEIAP